MNYSICLTNENPSWWRSDIKPPQTLHFSPQIVNGRAVALATDTRGQRYIRRTNGSVVSLTKRAKREEKKKQAFKTRALKSALIGAGMDKVGRKTLLHTPKEQ